MRIIIKFLFLFIMTIFSIISYSQEKIVLSGKVYNSFTKKNVDLATIAILEIRKKTYTDPNGSYSITIPQKGVYTIYVSSSGLKTLSAKIEINESKIHDFTLSPATIRGAALTVRGEREIQKISRRTLTVEDLKEVPASFGDSINALTSLPGVDRTSGGFFGPLVIRGADPHRNRYYIDGMPINDPLHLFGLHSIVANDLMSEIDLYSSAFPVKYGGPLAAVIEINTVDTVKKFGGIVDISMISASGLVKTPITRTVARNEELVEENAGYLIVSGRVGYLTLIIPVIYKLIEGSDLKWLPEYYDMQIKGKYFFTKHLSTTMLLMGSFDYWKLLFNDVASNDPDEGDDPLLSDIEFKNDSKLVNLGLYLTYDSTRFRNQLMFYASFHEESIYFNAGPDAASWAQDYHVDAKPTTYGIKEKVKIDWWKKVAQLRGALEFTYYDFKAEGKKFQLLKDDIDLGDESAGKSVDLDLASTNITFGGYLENRFQFGGLKVVPGTRVDYLKRSKTATVDPRGLVSYVFPSETTISLAGGKYSSFFQTNPFFFTTAPEYSAYGKMLKPERAYHSSFGIEQVIDLFTIGAEIFYNYSYDLAVQYAHMDDGEMVQGQSSGKAKAYGFEILIRKDKRKGIDDFFGWLSYTYTQSKEKSGILGNVYDSNGVDTGVRFDPYGDKWINNQSEREHAVKFVGGYKMSGHTFSTRIQVYSSLPYTEIVGSTWQDLSSGRRRYSPVLNDEKFTEHYPVDYQIDIRYSYQANYEWGHIKWYVEIVNVSGFWQTPQNNVKWKYNEPYSSNNPIFEEGEGLSWIPNFGVEIKF